MYLKLVTLANHDLPKTATPFLAVKLCLVSKILSMLIKRLVKQNNSGHAKLLFFKTH